ncbi:hypothetical protein [Flavobacterium sp.]|jgi:hypothetical protein|uniref:hypothetical protein n=1 Tax=Flavobacterium sp. TaxID=239 RepID=UPI0037C0AECE
MKNKKINLSEFITKLFNTTKKESANDWSEDLPIISRNCDSKSTNYTILLEIQTAESGAIILSQSNTTQKFLIRDIEGYGDDYLQQEFDSLSKCIDLLEKIEFKKVTSEIITKTGWLSRKLLFVDKTIKQELQERIHSYTDKDLLNTRKLLISTDYSYFLNNFNTWMKFSNITFKK